MQGSRRSEFSVDAIEGRLALRSDNLGHVGRPQMPCLLQDLASVGTAGPPTPLHVLSLHRPLSRFALPGLVE